MSESGKAENESEYMFEPEKEGSPFAECVSILLKSDIKVRFIS